MEVVVEVDEVMDTGDGVGASCYTKISIYISISLCMYGFIKLF